MTPHLARGLAASLAPHLIATSLYTVGDHRLHACLTEGTGPVVVFESGMGGGCTVWSLVLRHFMTPHPILTYDRFGIGGSPVANPPDRTVEAMGERLAALLSVVVPRRPVVLVGFSLGGLIVRAAASHLGERLSGMVLVDPCTEGVHQGAPDERLASTLFSVRAELHSRLRPTHEHRHESAAWQDAVGRWVTDAPPPPSCPTLVLRATNPVPSVLRMLSRNLRIVHQQRQIAIAQLAARLPQARLVDIASTHVINVHKPRDLAYALRDFLRTLDATPAAARATPTHLSAVDLRSVGLATTDRPSDHAARTNDTESTSGDESTNDDARTTDPVPC